MASLPIEEVQKCNDGDHINNSHKILINLVNSIESQTWNKWEVVFVDGESYQNHKNYLKNYFNEISTLGIYIYPGFDRVFFGSEAVGNRKKIAARP
mgnify:CR=1 FL=1